MPSKKTAVFISVLLYSGVSEAQFNDSTFHYVNFASSGIINSANNTNSYVFTNAFKYSLNKKSVRLNSTTTWIYGEQTQGVTNNDLLSALDFNLYKTFPNFYYWGLGTFEKSYSLRINYRYQAGLGAAYNLMDKPHAWVNISDGVLYENSKLEVNDSTDNHYEIARNSFRLRYRFEFNGLIVFDGAHYLQNSFSDGNDYIIKSASNLSFKIRKWLGLTTSLTYNKSQATDRANLLFTFGLTAEKYF
jgi:hypothetical protein